MTLPAIAFPSRRWQLLVALLAYLEEAGGPRSKHQAILFLRHRRMFNLSVEDEEYSETATEPRWETQLAWARQDSIDRGHMKPPKKHDAWEISQKGIEFLQSMRQRFVSGEVDIDLCDFWSDALKKWFLGARGSKV